MIMGAAIGMNLSLAIDFWGEDLTLANGVGPVLAQVRPSGAAR
jgi:hypothetical protein